MHAAVTDADDEMIVVVSVVLLAKFFGASTDVVVGVKVFAASIRVIQVDKVCFFFGETDRLRRDPFTNVYASTYH